MFYVWFNSSVHCYKKEKESEVILVSILYLTGHVVWYKEHLSACRNIPTTLCKRLNKNSLLTNYYQYIFQGLLIQKANVTTGK